MDRQPLPCEAIAFRTLLNRDALRVAGTRGCFCFLIATLSLVCAAMGHAASSTTTSTGKDSATGASRANADYGKIPLSFEPNRGQADPKIQFLSRGSGYSLFLTPGEAVLNLSRQDGKSSESLEANHPKSATVDTLRMKLVDANASAAASGTEPQPGIVNYLIGNDPKKWHSGIPTFGRVNYAQIYPGVDLVFYGNQRQLEYDFVVAPGADASRITWQIEGARPEVNTRGDLVLNAPDGPASFKAPVIYQTEGGQRIPVDGKFEVAGNQVRFKLGSYDHAKQLIIDPVLVYSSYLGSPVNEYSATDGESQIGWTERYSENPTQGLAVDSQGDVYVTGYTDSTDFPLQNPYQSTVPGPVGDYRSFAVFVTKFNPQGTGLIYSTYLGGYFTESQSVGTAIAVDAAGNAYVGGFTDDGSFPVTSGAYQTLCGANWTGSTRVNGCAFESESSAFLSKLDPTGQTLVYSTFLSGKIGSLIYAVAVDANQQAYVAGMSSDYCSATDPSYACFPTTANAILPGTASDVYQPSLGYTGLYTNNAFVTVFDAAGANLLYSTYIGDNTALISSGAVPAGYWGETSASAVAVDSAGEFFVTGNTLAPNLPITANALQGAPSWLPGACCQGFVAKFAPVSSGSTLDYLTYFGGPDYEGAFPSGITADSEGEAYVTGLNHDQNFPTTPGAFQTLCGFVGDLQCGTAFVSKINASGTALLWSTLLGNEQGGSGSTVATVGPVQLDSSGNVYIIGTTSGYYPDFPQVNPIQAVTGGNLLPFITEFNPTGSQVLFSTFFGSGGLIGSQNAAGLAVDASGQIYMAGNAYTAGVTTTPGAFQTSFYGAYDGYVAKISPFVTSSTALTVAPSPAAYGQLVTLTATVTGPANSSTPTGSVTFYNGAQELGTGSLNSSGIATYPTSTLTPATYSLTASYGGDSTFSPGSSTPQPLTVNPASQTITFTGLPAAATFGSAGSYALNGSASSGLPVSYSFTGPASIAGTTLTITGAGTVTVTASQTGNSDYIAAKAVSQTIVVGTEGQSIIFTGLPAAATFGSAGPYPLNGSASSGLPVSYAVTGPASIAGTTLTITGAGTVKVTASQAGNSNVGAATSVSQTIVVSTENQSITFNTIPTQTAGGSLTLTATSSSGLAVSFASTTTTVCTVNGNSASLLKAGTCTIQATQAGNTNFAAATPVSQSFTVNSATQSASFTITPIPAVETVNRGIAAVFLLELKSVNGFNGSVKLACSGGPTGNECLDFPQTVKLNGTALALSGILFQPAAKPGVYTITFTGVSGSVTSSTTATFTVK